MAADTPQLPVLLDRRAALLGRPGGWERYTHELSTRLQGVVTLTPSAPMSRAAATAWEWSVLPATARRHELVHFPAFPPTPLVGTRVVYTLHELVWWRYPETASRGGRLYYRRLAARAVRAAHLVTVSHAVAAEIAAELGVPRERLDVISPGVRVLAEGAEPEVRERPYLLTVGAIEPRKNLDRLLRAWADSGLGERFDLLLVGRAAWGRLPPGAEHLGAVSDERLAALYRGAAAVVSMSLYEGYGLTVAEALAAGGRVLCSDIGAHREVAGDFAGYADPLDLPSIVAGLRRAAAGDLPDPTGAAARFASWDDVATAHVALYERLLGG